MENIVVNEVLLKEKMDLFGNTKTNNFVVADELTVTITLNEYRELISKVAISDAEIKKANNDKWKMDSENKQLRESVAKLQSQLYEMQNPKENDE